MSTPEFQQDTPEAFTAKVQYKSRTEDFKANKINVQKSTDETGLQCWTLMAFHDTTDKMTGRPVANGIHLYIARSPKKGDYKLVPALSPPDLRKNSASYFKIVDDIPDANNELDTLEEYLGTGGRINYEWDPKMTTVIGTFTFNANDADGLPFKVEGRFKLYNPLGA